MDVGAQMLYVLSRCMFYLLEILGGWNLRTWMQFASFDPERGVSLQHFPAANF